MPRYNPATVEPKWQRYWEEKQTFAAPRLPEGEKLYVLDMFPYPSGDGLHVGHPEGYTATDIVCRYGRMQGRSVMHPMGWDAFGLPAEQHAIKTGTPPRTTTEKNIGTFRRQLKMLGFSYDWHRELATTDVEYFRWTQWIFLQLFDTWFDNEAQRGRPIAELPIPADVKAEGTEAVAQFIDEHRLAYQIEAPVNWCPALGTVLANEEVIGGLSERGGHPVQRLPMRQWMLRITAYADRLENDLDSLDWPHSIKALQRNWIGRSTGAEVDFFLPAMHGDEDKTAFEQWKTERTGRGFPRKPGDDVLRVFTTRPDTLFGATYMVIAPEHPAVDRLTTSKQRATVEAYCQLAGSKSDMDRTELAKEKTGVFSGSYAINPVNGEPVPIWIADYVLMGYGTGAIMAVPAHDTRDYEFAETFGIPITAVVDPGTDDSVNRDRVLAGRSPFPGNGIAINSGEYNGTPTQEFKERIAKDITEHGVGRQAINYKLRDWLFSRQHFWGEPFPILHELDDQGAPTGKLVPVPAEELPVLLPEMSEFKPHGRPEPPWAEAPEEWLYVTVNGKRHIRETNTMPQWAGSCWYYLRYLDPKNDQQLIDPDLERAWMPVDLYIGGAEHAVLHLLYARFWHKVLYDRGVITQPEPFQRLINQGMILGEIEMTGYQDDTGAWVSAADVKTDEATNEPVLKKNGQSVTAVSVEPHLATKKGENFVLAADESIRLNSRSFKMSKSRGNVVNPDAVVKEYGADALRLYEMFMGPLEATKPWNMAGVNGVRGFLDRVWRLIVDDQAETLELSVDLVDEEPNADQYRVLHKTIQGVTNDLDNMGFNTAIAKMMEASNFFTKQRPRPKAAMETLVLLLSPFAPHMAEELWQMLGHSETLAYEPWPTYDESLIKEDTIEIPVQINGKVRARVNVAADSTKDQMEAAAQEAPVIAESLAGKTIVKRIVVPGRLVNFVVK